MEPEPQEINGVTIGAMATILVILSLMFGAAVDHVRPEKVEPQMAQERDGDGAVILLWWHLFRIYR